MEMAVQGLLGKIGRQCYAVLCLGVILVSVTIAHYIVEAEDSAAAEDQVSSRRALHGRPLPAASSFY